MKKNLQTQNLQLNDTNKYTRYTNYYDRNQEVIYVWLVHTES